VAKIDRRVIGERIADRLRSELDNAKREYGRHQGVPTFAVDDLLPVEWAQQIYAAFPEQGRMQFKNSIKERKLVSAQMNEHPPILEEAVYAFQEPEVVAIMAEITGLRALDPDVNLYAGGISVMPKGGYLKPHLDNSHDAEQERYRVLNLLYYVTPGWKAGFGGSLEVWDEGPEGQPRAYPSLFNRLVVMATNRTSWHSVNEITSDGRRCCVSNYYFSKLSPESQDYFHATSFRGRPGEVVGDLLMRSDAALRTAVLKATGTKLYKNSHMYKRDGAAGS
jgi:Rps23 Pro-64 3,4-dihydroxylase Tpa1-like proline 4-hydroxylase